MGQWIDRPAPGILKLMSPFQQSVLRAVQAIPPGQVTSYGQIAAIIGAPRAARQVGWAMRSLETEPDFPWWRVISSTGRITIKGNQFTNAQMQQRLLMAEGVLFVRDFEIKM